MIQMNHSIIIIQQFFRRMEENLKFQVQNYWLEVKSEAGNLKICAVFMDQHRKVAKFSRTMDIEKQRRELLHFERAAEIVKMMKQSKNFSLDSSKNSLKLEWKLKSGSYEKDVECNISLFPQNLPKMEALQLENQFLKRKVQMFEQNKTMIEFFDESLSPKVSIDFPNPNSAHENYFLQYQDHQEANKIEHQDLIEISESEKEQNEESESKNKPLKKIYKNGGNRNNRNYKKRKTKKIFKKMKESKQKQNKQVKQIKIGRSNPQKKKRNNSMNITRRSRQNVSFSKIFPTQQSNHSISHEASEVSEKSNTSKLKIVNKIRLAANKIRLLYSNGDCYEGQINKQEEFHGFGVYTSKVTGIYKGQWVQGKAEGKGMTIDIEGNAHEGEYFDDEKHGWGTEDYQNGQKYMGDFFCDEKHGLGKYWYENGDIYEGQWKKNLCDGIGVQIYADQSMFNGIWKNDEKDGEGTFTDKNRVKFKQTWQGGILISQQKVPPS